MASNSKLTQVIAVRFSDEEKNALEQHATKLGVGIRQYIRSKVLEEQPLLIKHQKAIMRLIITGYIKLSALVDKELSPELVGALRAKAIEEQQKLGVAKFEQEP